MSVTFCGVVSEGDWEKGVPATFTEASLNVSNTSARLLAEHLGLKFDARNWAGEWPARDVKARCATAMAVGGKFMDDGVSVAASGGPGTGRCRVVDCGMRPGYFADRVAALEEVADECLKKGVLSVQYA